MRIERVTDLAKHDLAPDFHAITRSPELRETLQRVLALDGHLVAALDGNVIVGYAVDLPFLPIEFEGQLLTRRWHSLPDLRELGAIEIARQCRSRGLAGGLLEALAENERLETRIVLGEGLLWHWDFEGRGLSATDCRERLLKLFGSAGYLRHRTNEPEIAFSAYNFLVARIGSRVSKSSLESFQQALFQ